MASFLLAPLDAGGNVNPFLRLGEELQARGHVVHALAPAVLKDRLEDAGVAVQAFPGLLPTPHCSKVCFVAEAGRSAGRHPPSSRPTGARGVVPKLSRLGPTG